MEPGTMSIAVRAASAAVGPLVRKLFTLQGRGADLVHEPVRISGLVAWRGEKRTLTAKDVRKLVDELVARAAGAEPAGPGLSDGDRVVADALAKTLLAMGEIGMSDVQAVRLGPGTLAHTLRRRSPGATRYLSGDVEATSQLEEYSRQLGILVERVPQPVRDSAFEHRYAESVVSRYGSLWIFGLRLRQEEGAAWPLEAAYLSLEAAPMDKAGRQAERPAGRDPVPLAPRRIEQLLPGRDRVLLRGHAGSAKTTLLRWLAVSMARRTLPADGPALRGAGRLSQA